MKTFRSALIIALNFILLSLYGQQQGLNQQLMHAAADGDLNKVKELIEQGADIGYMNEHGYTVLDYASSVETVEYLHNLGVELTPTSYVEHCIRFMFNEPGNHLEIMKYFVENNAIQEHDFFPMYDANINQSIYIPEYVKFLEAHSVKYDKKEYKAMMEGYFEAAKENFFYGDSSSYPILKELLLKGIGIDQACKGFGEFEYGLYPGLYNSYFYFMDSIGIDFNARNNKSHIKWMGYFVLSYAVEAKDYSVVDFLLWLAEKGVFDETAVLFYEEVYIESPQMELYYLEGLTRTGYKFSKNDYDIIYSAFINTFYQYIDDPDKFNYVLAYSRYVKNQKKLLPLLMDVNTNRDMDEIINIIFALDHDNNKLVNKSSLKDLMILYEIYYGAIDDTNYEDYINFQSKRGRTMLMVACRLGAYKAVKSLIEQGADVTLEDVEGMTAIDYAKNTKIQKYLSKAK